MGANTVFYITFIKFAGTRHNKIGPIFFVSSKRVLVVLPLALRVLWNYIFAILRKLKLNNITKRNVHFLYTDKFS